MPSVLNPSELHLININSQCQLYCNQQHIIPSHITSFEEALNPIHYQNLFQPFAFIFINTNTKEVLLIRDHLGISPLYYCAFENQFIFGENLPDILNQLQKPPVPVQSEVENLFADIQTYHDHTIYEHIKRVEPGHMVHYKPNGQITKFAFWELAPEGQMLYYKDDREYLEHFTDLMRQSVQDATQGTHSIAAEFSAGMDSTAIYGTCRTLGLNPDLFMHAPLPNSEKAEAHNPYYEHALIAKFPEANIHRIMSDGFNPEHVFKEYAAWFAGTTHIFELFAHNIHRAVSDKKHTLLLSGLGGDQGVSHPASIRFILPELIQKKNFREAFRELSYHQPSRHTRLNQIAHILLLIQSAHPALHQLIHMARDLKINIYNLFKQTTHKQSVSTHPHHKQYFKSLREAEWSFLQGPHSHGIRTRIEYSSIVAKKMGFEYRYPLLHPKLLEFFLALPFSQKRHQGIGRYMMRRYLAQLIPTAPYDTYQKREGLNIMPATLDTFKMQLEDGTFKHLFTTMPFDHLIQDKSPHKTMIKTIRAFIFNAYHHTG